MPIDRRFWIAVSGASLLMACASGPRLPDPEPIERGEIERTDDWKDWGGDAPSVDTAALGERLSAKSIDSAFRGRVLRGCYPNGEAFAEYLADDGKFYDALRDNAELGGWGLTDNKLCFRYPERAAQDLPDSCFVVMRKDSAFDFYTADLSSKVASTNCPKS